MTQPLTVRATRYLAGLKRIAVPSTTLVERQLATLVAQVPATWLDFHERYGGYVVPMNATEEAVLGLMHSHPTWLAPMKCDVEEDPDEDDIYIACADVHPSYDYRLDKRGHFLGQAAESFEINLERAALSKEFRDACAHGLKFQFGRDNLPPQLAEELDRLLTEPPVPEASDEYYTYYRSEHLLVQQSEGEPLRIWFCVT
jgi:hypothetical protein